MNRQKVRKTIIFISALLFPITMVYFSPYVITLAAMHSIINGSLITFSLMLVLSIFFGRLFCGWVCPGAGFGEMAGCINQKSPKLGRLKLIKYGVWAIWLSIVIALYIKNGGLKYFDPLYYTAYGVSITEPDVFLFYYPVVFALFGLPLFFGKRAFCHYLCWMAPFMNIGIKIRKILHLPGIYLHTDKEKCVNCKLCNKNCAMGLDIHQMVQDGKVDAYECSMCGACIDACPKKAIKYSFGQEPNTK